jgi:glutamate/tyrosine decarboxylase-like PLP-dependent enzyme
MRQTLLDLEKQSRILEPSAGDRGAVRDKIVSYTEDFLENIEIKKAYNVNDGDGAGLLDSDISEKGIGVDEAIRLLEENVHNPAQNPASPGHLGYIPGGGLYYSALGDYLADVFNRYTGVFYVGPGAVRMENMLIRWMCGIMGYPESGSGNLTSGGSLGNLIAVVTAREAKNIRARDIERSVIYLSDQAHHSIDKAIRIAGLQECVVRRLPLDERYKIIPSALREQVESDIAEGLQPFLVVASAGTTDVGAVDSLGEIGDIAAEFDLWYHIDAAYGGFFRLTGEGKAKLTGTEKSDSIVIDPHKGLFVPYGLGVVLVKDRSKLEAAHYHTAHYMQDALASEEEPSPADLSPELTRPFRGLRLWLPLKLHGTAPFRACLEEKLLLAKYFYEEVQKLGFVCDIEPELSVVVYRYEPETGDADEFNKRLLDEVIADGRIFISSTILDGKFTLRFACLAFRTHLETVDTLLTVLKEKIKMIENL